MTLNELKRKENLDFNILSERLLLKRTDRPDEWSMDELASMALKIETRVKELEHRLKSAEEFIDDECLAEEYQNEINDCSMWGNVNEDVS